MAEPGLRGPLPFALVLAAIAAAFAALPAWRDRPPPPAQRYAIATEAFAARVEADIAAHATGETVGYGIPVVRPPPGDVHVLAQRWQFRPMLELRAGETYRLHVASSDILHGFALDGIDLLLAPGDAQVVTLVPDAGRSLVMQCSEYCGQDHNLMKSLLRVLPAER